MLVARFVLVRCSALARVFVTRSTARARANADGSARDVKLVT